MALHTPSHSGVGDLLSYASERPLSPGTLVRVPLGTREVLVASITQANAQGLIDHARALGLQADYAPDANAALAECPLVVTCTTAQQAVLHTPPRADAFVAASLSMFPRPALLAFLALGPMLDLKLLPAFLSVFQRRVALMIILAPAAAVYLLAMGLGLAGVLE